MLKGKIRKDYEDAIEKFCQDNKGATIYLAGEVSHPGISDLDFLIVEKKPVVDVSVRPFLMGGNVLIVPEHVIENVLLLEDIRLKKLQGRDYVLNTPPEEHKIIEVLEWLPERILKCMWCLNQDYKLEDTLLLHKSINRSIDNVSQLLGRKYENITTSEARESISIKSKDLLDSSISSGMTAWKDFDNFLKESGKISGTASGHIRFCRYYSSSDIFESLLLYFHCLSNQDSLISEELKKRVEIISKDFSMDKDLKKYALNRWKILNQTYAWFVKKELSRGMIKYGWFLNDAK
jgi:hypothetical protein